MKSTIVALWITALLLGGCAAWRPTQSAAGASLRVTLTDVVKEDGGAKVRGVVHNDLDQSVEGLRYVVTVYSVKSMSKVLDRWQHQDDTRIAPGGSTAMRLSVQSKQFGGASTTRFGVEAFPVALDGHAVAPPAGWVAAD